MRGTRSASEAKKLPDFNSHKSHLKNETLTRAEAPNATISWWLSDVADRRGTQLKVLDLGCGRGGRVAWLLEQGFDAYGLEVQPAYVARGQAYVGEGRLRLIVEGRYPFEDGFFDVVISDQVLEHVEQLDPLCHEVRRVVRADGVGLHVFPAKRIVREPHLELPFVHWLPKGWTRWFAIAILLKAGRGAAHFPDLGTRDRATIFSRYSKDQTYYRSLRKISREWRRAGFEVDVQRVTRARVSEQLGWSGPSVFMRAAAWAYRNFRVSYLEILPKSTFECSRGVKLERK
ncbi:hypothetical protein GCM10027270_35610 [Nocardioides ginkgobilobae]